MYNISMWSNNKKVDITINILLFLLGINFLHYGQLVLPAICVILFIDNKCKFEVANIKNFMVLVIFAISFFTFSYRTDLIYSLFGFFIPMAYYIGSNLKNHNQKNILKIIYLLGFGMICHVVLNFGYDLYLFGIETFFKHSHYDIWLHGKVQTTVTAVNYTFIIACFYYLCKYEINKRLKSILLILFTVASIYELGLGRRTPIMMFAVSLFVSLFLDYFIFKNREINKKHFLVIFGSVIFVIIVAMLTITLNIFGIGDVLSSLLIVDKFMWLGLKAERLEILLNALKLLPYNLWGGQAISNILDIQIHDLWFDVFDYAGVITFVMLVTHSFIFLCSFIKSMKSNRFATPFKVLSITFFTCCLAQLLLEPIMTSCSIFFICLIIVESAYEGFVHDKKN